MTNRDKFKEVFGKDIKWSEAIEPQMLALKSAQINEIDCMEEWLNAEYKAPTTKNNLGVDCVARQDVERFIEGFINEYTPEEELEFINLELDGLKHLPPVTPQEQKIGHWTTVLHEEILFCSECHQRLVDEQTYIPLHYCPNCGARMVEPQESEDENGKID